MSYTLPPLNGLRAFEAAGRHLSFKRAADELSVTPGAVSQQIKHIEQMLGVPLFQRMHRGLTLTAHGEALLPAVGEAFETISAATEAIGSALPARRLRLGIAPDLAADPNRLLQQLADTRGEPLPVRASSTGDVADLLSGAVDALLRTGPGPYPGMHAEALSLHPAFAPNASAWLVVWPGLARCREFVAARSLLAGG